MTYFFFPSQFLRKVFEDEDDGEAAVAERSEQELALAKAVEAMAMGLENDVVAADELIKATGSGGDGDEGWPWLASASSAGGSRTKDYRKMAVLYMLLSACVADVNMAEEGMGSPRIRRGYDARHRVALRLLATWLDVKWIKMVRFVQRFHCFSYKIRSLTLPLIIGSPSVPKYKGLE